MIDVSDLFCIYRGPERDVAALRGLSLRVEEGERVLVHGPSGSGKTTLMRVLAGVERPSAGRALVGGVDLGGADRAAVADHARRSLGMIDQRGGRNLRPELRCVDNVALQPGLLGTRSGERRRHARALLDDLDLGHLARRWPYELSGGEAQRVAACAALAHDPRLILADEPTGELDAESADRVYDLLVQIAARRGATLLIVSHDPRAARIADRVVRIRDGRLSGERSPATAVDEAAVVDDRGWLRLPEELRRAAGIRTRARVSLDAGGVRIDAAGPAADADPAGDVVAEPATPPPAVGGAVVARLEGIRRVRGDRAVLDGVDLEVAAGALTILRGRSGSGKSTLLRIVAGLERPDAGRIVVAGQDLGTLDRRALAVLRRREIAIVLQRVALADALDVYENLDLAAALRRSAPRRADAICAALGLDGLRGRPARLLSGGERQRVGVAWALVSDAALVLLDEPTSQLDEANADALASLLRDEAERGRAILCATHDPVLVARGHAVVELTDDPAIEDSLESARRASVGSSRWSGGR